jgi:hypothetical protein
MNRREFLTCSVGAGVAAGITSTLEAAVGKKDRAPRILLRSSWQSVNIGDIGHTPGALALLQKYIPQAEVTLWPGSLAGSWTPDSGCSSSF